MSDIGAGLLQGQQAAGGLFTGLQKGQDFVNGLFQLQAARKAGGLISQGDYAGAGAALGDVGDLAAQQGVAAVGRAADDRANTQQYLSQELGGDFTGAGQTAALTADPTAVANVQAAGLAARQRDTSALAQAADGLLQISVPDDPAATNALRHQTFTSQIAPVLKSQYGLTDDQIAAVDHSDLSDQSLAAFKTSLGHADAFKSVTTPDGNVIAFNERTGKATPAYEGTPKPITTDGGYLTQGDDGKWHFNATGPKAEYKVVQDSAGNSHVILVGGGITSGTGADAGVATGSGPVPTGKAYDDIAAAAVQAGASPSEVDFLKREAQIESGGRNVANGASKGVFQFHQSTFDANGGGDINSLQDQTKAALTLARNNASALQKAGLPVTPGNMYLLHQQGPGGLALLKNPNANAVDVLTGIYGNANTARQAVVNNGGSADQTAGQFAAGWARKFSGTTGAPLTPNSATATPSGAQEVYSTASEGGASGGLSPEAITQAAKVYAVTGTLPALARGKAGNADKEAIINQAATLGGGAILSAKSAYKAQSGALDIANQRLAVTVPAVQKAKETLDAAIQFAQQMQAAGTPVVAPNSGLVRGLLGGLNSAVNSAANDKNFIHYKNLIDDANNEQAAAVSGARSGGSTDAARREAHTRVNAGMPLDTIVGARDAFGTVVDLALKSAQDNVRQRQADIDNTVNFAKGPTQQAAPMPAPASQRATVAAPPRAIALLRQNPQLASAFDAKYGQGASRAALGR